MPPVHDRCQDARSFAPPLRDLAALAAKDREVAVLWLYGSRAKGTATADSDYDLAVAFGTFESDPLQRRLRPELLAQDWQDALGMHEDQLSIIDINLVPLTLAHAVIRTGRVLHANDRLRLIREENRITSMWEIDHLYHQRHHA
ncbi:type VII toxin-antitoxin system MntA family adenylyltransferase antitoxin [Halomonas maura]|uniref:type VII toxin-antitoxin system MntA family adenylyltransferase antitoxin n=1 Tax=Halomonas maura TaxID=117606 RepID=UPI0025B37CD7|nr:nucleotidyltransferase domain-containing protein [Halomonas maura]MDN3554918.1 nucleotidyltransferase domain-containing protein [Halomonas maura]